MGGKDVQICNADDVIVLVNENDYCTDVNKL